MPASTSIGSRINPWTVFGLAGGGYSAANDFASLTADAGKLATSKSPMALPTSAVPGVAEASKQGKLQLNEDSVVLSGAMLQIFDGGKLVLGQGRQADKHLDKSEFPISSFDAIDLTQDGLLNQAELYLAIDKETPAKRRELLAFLGQQGEKAKGINNKIKWIARSVGIVDIVAIAAPWVLRFVFKIWSTPVSAIVSVVPPIVAQTLAIKGVEKQIDKLNVLRDDIAQKYDQTVKAPSDSREKPPITALVPN